MNLNLRGTSTRDESYELRVDYEPEPVPELNLTTQPRTAVRTIRSAPPLPPSPMRSHAHARPSVGPLCPLAFANAPTPQIAFSLPLPWPWPLLAACSVQRGYPRLAAALKPDTKPEEKRHTQETERTQRQSQTHSLGAHRDGASFHM